MAKATHLASLEPNPASRATPATGHRRAWCLSPPLYCWPVLRSTVTHLEFPTHSPLELQVLACGTTMPAEVASPKLDSAGGKLPLLGSPPCSPQSLSLLSLSWSQGLLSSSTYRFESSCRVGTRADLSVYPCSKHRRACL